MTWTIMETIRFCAAATRGKDLRWGKWDWPLVTSVSERAILELLDAVAGTRNVHQADVLFEGLPNLSPRKLQSCREGEAAVLVVRSGNSRAALR
ncbi:MAG TPA: type IV toxin-antitoxin system AbiEi family antitoxin domain-containing protein [Candidatus Sulfotelmatobacter sp.]|nr:type IV toxin-antitoxin system AbiEi family antitoxin domain-containing protein [Candidatus Sulfotelmatobacter sp.]